MTKEEQDVYTNAVLSRMAFRINTEWTPEYLRQEDERLAEEVHVRLHPHPCLTSPAEILIMCF